MVLKPLGNDALPPAQQRFAEEYIVDLNGTQAAIRAGYKATSAMTRASQLLATESVQAEVVRLQALRSARVGIRADTVLREIARIGMSDVRRIMSDDGLRPPGEWDDDSAAAVASIEVESRGEVTVTKVKLWDKNAALEKLCKHLGLYEKDNSQKPIIINLAADDAAL